jgi:putative tricarboxylic transport membrane protein
MKQVTGPTRHMLTRRHALTALTGAATLPLIGGRAKAAWAPTQPITVVVHWAAGGGTDLVFRGMAEVVNSEKLCPQPWIVVNRAGGAGLNGFKYLLDQSGDPHTLGAITPSVMAAVLQQKVNVDWRKALPVGNLIVDPQILVVHSKFPQKTIDEFIAAAKAKPNSIRVAGAQLGQEDHLTNLVMEQGTGIQTRFIAVEGGVQVKQNLAGGHVDAGWLNPSELVGSLEKDGGTLVPLAVALKDRLSAHPNLPTFIEKGHNVVFDMFFRGVVAPPNLNADAIAFHTDVIKRATDTAKWKAFCEKIMVESNYIPPTEYGSALDRWNEIFVKLMPLVSAPR